MKTIFVPTDFSHTAYQAACYALALAKRFQAPVHLFHVMDTSDKTLLDTAVIWPLINYETVKQNIINSMEFFKQALEDEDTNPDNLKIPLTYSIGEGRVYQVVKKIVQQQHPLLLVAGMYGASNIKRLFFGSKSSDFIDHVPCPILLIPPEAKYQKIQKIALATDLSSSDIELIELLAAFARPFDAEILIAHISADPVGAKQQQHIDSFLNEVTCKNNYDKIYYRHIAGESISKGIFWLSENGQVDMLTMVHRPRSLLSRLLSDSYTKHLARRIKIPLMVLKPHQPIMAYT